MESGIPPQPRNAITAVRYIQAAPMVKLVINSRLCLRAVLHIGGDTYPEYRNHIEPFDFFTHVFMVPEDNLCQGEVFTLSFDCNEDEAAFRKGHYNRGTWHFLYEGEAPVHPDALYRASLNDLNFAQSTRRQVAQGVEYVQSLYLDRLGLPVRTFALLVDTKAASFIVGTPDDGYKALGCRQSVIGQMQAALDRGRSVIAGINGDFFDMFGDFSPSGPCVKDRHVVWTGDEKRPVLGQTNEGSLFIGELSGHASNQMKLDQAIGGMPLILKDEMPYELLLGEPFGDMRHPRTAVGLGRDGKLILLVVDGRIQDYSNGASLGDLALLLQKMGAYDALNLDGGGSSILVLNQDGRLTTMNRPADLIRPNDNIIREIYNCLLIMAK